MSTAWEFRINFSRLAISFPISSNNMHMNSKVREKFPLFDKTALNALYGSETALKTIMTNDSLVDELKKIDLRRFFWETRKNYALVLCRFGQIDCRKDWKLIGTLAGVCLRYDPNHHRSYSPHDSLVLTFKISSENFTVGWWKENEGLSVFTTHLGEEDVLLPSHGTFLDSDVIPIVTVQNTKRTYLGEPYTKCIDYGDGANWHKEKIVDDVMPVYKEYTCLQFFLADTIFRYCNCFPSYVDVIYRKMKNLNKIDRACNWLQHASCAAPIIKNFEWSRRNLCPLECSGYRFRKQSVQYKVGKRFNNRKYGTIKYSMADVLLVEMTETESYPIFACISDTGGAAGLFLGLNLIGIFPIIRQGIEIFITGWRKRKESRKYILT